MPTAPATPTTPRATLRRIVVAAIAVAAIGVAVDGPLSSPVEAGGVASSDWLGVVNAYRAQSGLSPVAENPAWSGGAQNHSCWMLLNGIAHDEAPGTAGYTTAATRRATAATLPCRAIRTRQLEATSNSGCRDRSTPSASCAPRSRRPDSACVRARRTRRRHHGSLRATLDVIRGNNWGAPKPAAPVVFPGNGSTTSLTRFVAESPDPRTFCGWGGQSVGLPLIALMPSAVTAANATLNGPNGPIPTCVLHKGNTSGTASAILGGDNAVLVIPCESPRDRGIQRDASVPTAATRPGRSTSIRTQSSAPARRRPPRRPRSRRRPRSPRATRSSPSHPSASPTPGSRESSPGSRRISS